MTERNRIYTVCIYGDPHLYDRDYGRHKNYPEESLWCFEKITEIAKKREATHIIGTGDLASGVFRSLSYRERVEKLFEEQRELTNGRVYQLKGNHDISGKALTEYDFYIRKGVMQPSCNLKLGGANISMIDFGKEAETALDIEPNKVNIAVVHNYYKFKDTQLPPFGEFIELDNYDKFYGLNFLICGHVHKRLYFSGSVSKAFMENGQTVRRSTPLDVYYLGSASRPAYNPKMLDTSGAVFVIDIYNTGEVAYDIEEFDLWSEEEAFTVGEVAQEKERKQEKKEEQRESVNISDIVRNLDEHSYNFGEPVDVIRGLQNVPEAYKNKAIQLLQEA